MAWWGFSGFVEVFLDSFGRGLEGSVSWGRLAFR